MGGYGLYYATVMQAIGIVVLADPRVGLAVDTVTPAGQVVASAFRSAIAETEYYQHFIDRHNEPVPYEVVAEYGQRACYCRLREPTASDRPVLVDAFLHGGNDVQSAARRETFRFMCELSAQSAAHPVDQSSFRRLIYFGADYGQEDVNGATFFPTESTMRSARRWRLYQAREYFNASINEMWRRLTYWGLRCKGDVHPVPMSEVLGSLDNIDFTSFASSVEVELPASGLFANSSYKELLDWVMNVGAVTGELDDRWRLDAALTEDAIIQWLDYGRYSRECGPDRLAAALVLVTFVAARLWRTELAFVEPDDWFPVVEGGSERLGMQRFLNRLRDDISEGTTVRDVAEWLTVDYVITQHERVATAKLSSTGDTFRFRREAGRLRFFEKDARVGMNNSRFNALATFLFELGWCGYLEEAGHELTEEGETIRVEGDLQETGVLGSADLEWG